MLYSKKITIVILSIFLLGYANAQVYYVSSSQGNDQNDGLSIQTPFQSIEKLNSIVFSPGIQFILGPEITGKECFG